MEEFCFNDWLSGFIMGQLIYESKNTKEMAVSIPNRKNLVNKFQNILNLEGTQCCNKHVFKLTGKKLQSVLNENSPKSFNLSFLAGMIESDFSIVINIYQTPDQMTFKNYIKVQDHPIIKNKLELFKIIYRPENQKLKITKSGQLKRFFDKIAPRFFYLYGEKVLLFKKYLQANSMTERATRAQAFNSLQ